jgi:putative ATPase
MTSDEIARTIPLAERMRPSRMEEMVGQDHLLGPGASLERALKGGRIESMIFWGPPGSGKTTLARLCASYTYYPFQSFSAVTSGLKELREVISGARKARDRFSTPTLLFVDEIHRFNKAQQDAFLPHVESGLVILIGATTQNPSFEIIPPLLSRTRVIVLNPLEKSAIKALLLRALADDTNGLGRLNVQVSDEALDMLAALAQGDGRAALNGLESVVVDAAGPEGSGPIIITPAEVARIFTKQVLHYDKDGEEHYNLISAFHKSLRGSDSQAGLYWLYRMLQSGEDPLFIARRMIRFASEDIGLADPHALPLALAAFDAWRRVGPPEAELALAEAAVYLAEAPKSNALYVAEKEVKKEIRETGQLPVPMHIRNAPTALMKTLGFSKGYRYPHNYPGAWVDERYLPEGIQRRVFYKPTERGFERELKRRSVARRKRAPDL